MSDWIDILENAPNHSDEVLAAYWSKEDMSWRCMIVNYDPAIGDFICAEDFPNTIRYWQELAYPDGEE